MLKRVPVVLAATALILAGYVFLFDDARAQSSEEGVKIGTLTCKVSSGWGFVFGSSKDLKCVFSPDGAKMSDRYRGTIKKFGLDVGYTEAGVIVRAVFAPTKNVGKGALIGNYAGVTAAATVGVGAGANVIIGGGNSVSLQPLSLSGQKGLNAAGGIASIELKSAN